MSGSHQKSGDESILYLHCTDYAYKKEVLHPGCQVWSRLRFIVIFFETTTVKNFEDGSEFKLGVAKLAVAATLH